MVISVVATAILPHLLKRLFAQERPDGGVASALGQSPRCLSLRPCHARRRSRFCHLLGMSKVSAPGMGSWQLGCCNPDRSAGVLDDGCSRRPCDGSFRRKMRAFVERCVGLFHGLGPPTGRDRRPIRRLTRPRLGALPHRRRDASAREGRQEPRQAIRTDPANASSRAAADNHD
jgi:hypothetical protein